jgi:hypothetical protein
VVGIYSHNEETFHNAGITARLRIFFPAKAGEKAEWVAGFRVREFTAKHVTPGCAEYKELQESTTECDRERLRGLRLLRYVNVGSDEIGTRKNLADAGRLLDDLPKSMLGDAKDPKSVAQVLYSMYLTGEMKEARLVIYRTKRGEFTPVLRCPNMKTAFYAFAAFRGVEACLNCQKLFAVDAAKADGSTSERYCTAACGQRYRQKIYRLRQKARSKRESKRKEKKR